MQVGRSTVVKKTYSMYALYVPVVLWTAMLVFNDIYKLTETVPYMKLPVCVGHMFCLYLLTLVGSNAYLYTNLTL